jgi:hypothetical protein
VPADPHPVVTADPHPVVPANPLMALTDSALAGYVDCTLFETTTAAGQRGAVLSVRPRYRALWWLAAVVLAVAVLGAFQLRTEAAIVRNTDAAPHRSPASFDLTVVRRSVSEADRMTFDVVVTPLCADAK